MRIKELLGRMLSNSPEPIRNKPCEDHQDFVRRMGVWHVMYAAGDNAMVFTRNGILVGIWEASKVIKAEEV